MNSKFYIELVSELTTRGPKWDFITALHSSRTPLYLEAGAKGVASDGEVGDLDPCAVVEAAHHAQVVLHPGQVVEMAQHLQSRKRKLKPACMVHGYKVFWHIRSVFGAPQSEILILASNPDTRSARLYGQF